MRIKITSVPEKKRTGSKPKRKMTAQQLRGLLIHRCAQRISINRMIDGLESKLRRMRVPYHSF